MSDDDRKRNRDRFRVPIDNFTGKPMPADRRRYRRGKGFFEAQERHKKFRESFRRKQQEPGRTYAWMCQPSGVKPAAVITDPRGMVRLSIWKNWINGGHTIRYVAQITVLYWNYSEKRLSAKFTLGLREMFVLAKCLHAGIDWCCKDAKVSYPTQLFEHCQVGFEVQWGPGEHNRVVVSSEEEARRVVEESLVAEDFDPKKFQMPDLMEQFRERTADLDKLQEPGQREYDAAFGVVKSTPEDDRSE